MAKKIGICGHVLHRVGVRQLVCARESGHPGTWHANGGACWPATTSPDIWDAWEAGVAARLAGRFRAANPHLTWAERDETGRRQSQAWQLGWQLTKGFASTPGGC